MRLSVDKTDPGNRNWHDHMAGHVHAYLDGVKQTHVITCDDEEGLVVRFKTDADGNLVVNETRDEIVREELRGAVKIVFDA